MPTFHRKNHGTAARHIRPYYRLASAMRREPFQKFFDRRNESDFDSGCWVETNGAALTLRTIRDHRGDAEQ
jgi:hypothetical protein